ncbi:cell death abnormality protein 1-like [Mya arenaria]|uniref:cell death abnormality protein 1-like n=1 Tax=Mya arenaria TaxID=6604 RepID=UPI0022E1D19D|nr:cell death abnormality protein 1-like [Mya arenaria]
MEALGFSLSIVLATPLSLSHYRSNKGARFGIYCQCVPVQSLFVDFEMSKVTNVFPEIMDQDVHHVVVNVLEETQRATRTTDTVQMACSPGEYGQDCSSNCGHCRDGNTTCNNGNGQCPDGCTAGYKGSLCNSPCDPGEYGLGCISYCGQCRDGNTTCNTDNGYCPHGCTSGYKRQLCIISCASGEFGPNCSSNCGYCHGGNTTCNSYNGHCQAGCAAGYKGDLCKTKCDKHYFGINCNSTCHCDECDKEDGSCGVYSCFSGWIGDTCSEPMQANQNTRKDQSIQQGNTAVVVVAAVASTLLFVSIVTNVVQYCRRKSIHMKCKEKTDTDNYTAPGPPVSSDYDSLDVTELSSTRGKSH